MAVIDISVMNNTFIKLTLEINSLCPKHDFIYCRYSDPV